MSAAVDIHRMMDVYAQGSYLAGRSLPVTGKIREKAHEGLCVVY
jgi:hypothetical protein